jgi:NADH-quinone oxidoreductase subunit M
MTADPAAAIPDALHGAMLLLTAAAVVAPLIAVAVLKLGGFPTSPRTPAAAALFIACLAASGIVLLWNSGNGESFSCGERLGGGSLIQIDGITAVLMPTVAVIELAILLVAPKRFLDVPATARILFAASATFAAFSTAHPLVLVAMWVLTALPTWISIRGTPGSRPASRVFATAMLAALACLTSGTVMMLVDPPWERHAGVIGNAGGWLVALAVLIRKGIFPFHSWYPALFSGAPMSTALAATMPQIAAYTAVRLLIGHADHGDGVALELVTLSQLALVTAVYGGALALVQRDLRGLIGTLAMSQSAMVLAGLAGKVPMELNGAFCVWISSGLALTGIGLVAWAIESRAGPLSLATPQGRFRDAPALAAFFLLFGLAAIGLPGTLSFVADDLIVSGSLDDQLHAGLMTIASTVLCAIAVLRGWFMVFGGPTAIDGPKHLILRRERVAMTGLLVPLFLLGLYPAPLVRSLERAAGQLLGVPVEEAGNPPPSLQESSSGS